MVVKAYRTQAYEHTHENEIFNEFLKKLEAEWEDSEDLVLLFGNFYCQNTEIDAAVLKKKSITVIDFKNYGGEISFSENGPWLADGEIEVKGGSKTNPFIQIRDNRRDFLKTLQKIKWPSGRQPDLTHISGLVLFHQPITFDKNQLPGKIKPWFHVVDFDHVINKLAQITSREITLSKQDLEHIVKELNIPEYIPAGSKAYYKQSDRSIPSYLPSQSSTFVEYGSIDQESYLSQVEQALESHQEVMLWGMGGVGKTELALQYAQKHKANYVAQYWLSIREKGLAAAVVELAAPYIDLPEALQGKSLDDQAVWYWQNWLPDQGNLLVILDDVPTSESLLDRAMPKQERVKVIVTTQNRELDVRFESVDIKEMPLVSAIELLENIVGTEKVARELYTLEAICDAVERLPLAVELMGEYLKKNRHLTFSEVQQKLDLAGKVLSQDRSYRDYGHRGVAAALQLSWGDISESSRNLAMFLSLFDRASIHWALVKSIAKSTDLEEGDLDEARGELDRFHFLRPINEDCTNFTVHALIQAFCEDKLTEQPALNITYRRVFLDYLLAISKQIPQTPTLVQIQAVAPAIPHLERLSQEEFLVDIAKEDLIWAFLGIAWFYQGQGFYALAEPLLKRALFIRKQQLGTDHPDTARSLNHLSLLYYDQGRYSEAEPLLKQSMSIIEQQLGADHPDTATSLNSLGEIYRAQGRYGEAESQFIRALSIREQQLGANHPDTASSLHNLAVLYYDQGSYSEAEPLYIRALSIHKRQLGDDHPDTAASLSNLAGLYESQGRYSEAEPLYKSALAIREQKLGADHPKTAITLNNLAYLYKQQGRYSEAEPFYAHAVEIFWGKDYRNTQAIIKQFVECLQQAIERGQGEQLSAHPLTQSFLEEIKVKKGKRKEKKGFM